ncbi:acetate--CoA ligase family protein [Rhizobium rhizogenes]|uniref:ATP-grasp domain-containing protein n=1 Tax=Rhizobium rhizogenes NBRC 13257 TaxID=1220581 RepID=A0AA87U4N4_RHIRH|nr:acetate--CoA ligase family protein [Rhizobium rhizogenes]NTF58679.1 acetate--CoA ligase family protein [Rhizobium rhizogenes]NTF78261.1 acetate--CoA ligase family protein [Rhizobium rhizogenes]NTF97184.1 acetate--CoA ligase family protein [Rhizobium rhizogenes]NTG64000.1 acetate--CoA ligase family protein [Rhizobium rhizogenes]NTG70582.1 acetate--CoA ligase family protein [Rhizobium rhizogenes]
MTQRSLDRLIRPQTIAVFGGREARRVIEQCDRMGFSGDIWPVHPTLESVLGRRCYRSVEELPLAPDAAFVGVNRLLTVDIVRALSARGAGGAVCYASGFSEAVAELADGIKLQEALVNAAGDTPIVGPNCYGVINGLDGALLWPDQHGMVRVESGVAILTQSSNIAINLSMQQRGLPLAYLMTAGNQAQIGLSDLALAVLEDPRVTAIGLHIEGFGSVQALQKLATRAGELRKPVVALKVGKSEQAQRAAVSHTASLAGSDAVADAVLARLGIGRVATLPEMIETLKLLHVTGPLTSNAISSMSCSGGEASLMADAATGRAVDFRALKPEQLPALRRSLGEMVTLSNPLDYHTFVWGDLDRQTEAFTAMFEGGYALNLIVLDFPRNDRCDGADWMTTVAAISAAAKQTGARAGVLATLPENMPETVALQLIEDGIVPLCGISETIAAAEIASRIEAAWRAPPPLPLLDAALAGGEIETLNEAVAKAELAAFGLTVPVGATAASPGEAAEQAERLGFPVALKALGVEHKSEAGAVVLNLRDMEAVRNAAHGMAHVASGYLIERMIERPVVELIVGAVRDPALGLALTVGAGGILVELLEDSVILALPVTRMDVLEAISRLKVRKLIEGYRGGARGNLDLVVDAVVSTAEYVVKHAARLEELDINPLMVLPGNRGVVAADALIRRRR